MNLHRSSLLAAVVLTLAACDSSSSSSGDGNNTPETADVVSVNSTSTGTVSSETDEDWYSFTTPGAGYVTVTLYGLTADADLEIYDASGNFIDGSYGTGTFEAVYATAYSAQTFYVVVYGYGDVIDYSMDVDFTASGGACDSYESESNGTSGTADYVSMSSTVCGSVTSGDYDYFYFVPSYTGYVDVDLYGLSSDADLYLYDSYGSTLDSSTSTGSYSEYVTGYVYSGYTYYVRVVGYGSTNYSLDVY